VLGAFLTPATLKLNFVPEARVEEVKVSLTLNLLEEGEEQTAADS
jgi:hypothetical protein